jgi:thiol-disulfide isomerase/thioredoxin
MWQDMLESPRRIAPPFAILALMLIVLLPTAGAQADLALAPGDPAPVMRGRTAAETFFKTDYQESSATVVNFWAIWCEPCKEEMPALQKLYDKHASSGLQIVSVLHDNATDDAVREYITSLGVSYPVIRPHRGSTQKWKGVGVLPTTFLIDREGTIIRRYVGATTEQIAGLVYDIEATLEGRPLGPFVVPETPAIATEEDRLRHVQQSRDK